MTSVQVPVLKDCYSEYSLLLHAFEIEPASCLYCCETNLPENFGRYQKDYGCCVASVSQEAAELSKLVSDGFPFSLDLGSVSCRCERVSRFCPPPFGLLAL